MTEISEAEAVVPRPASAILTFLIADVRGYTRFTVEQGDEAAARLADRFAALCEDVLGAHQGRVIELRGDEALAVFSSARNALHGAVALQQAFKGAVADDPSLPLRVGMGLTAGEAIPVRGGYRGGVLNVAARLCSIAGAGEILASERLIDQATQTDGLAFVDRGQVTLKGLPTPVRVLQIAPEGDLPDTLPPLQPILVTHPNNLPDDPTPFIGREGEIARIAALVRDPHIRLVTLTGPGGTGKTRLALQVGNTLLYDYADGVFFCDLSPLADASLVPSIIAGVLGVKEEGGRDLTEALVEQLRGKHLLLVLDNFEHLLDAAQVVSSLLDACRTLCILVTSRIPLHLSREQEHAVPPLAVPDLRQVKDAESLSQYESVALFVQRARAARDTFALNDDNAPAVAEICARLDGLPLAIELAAARIKLFPPQALLQRLESRLRLLSGGARDKPTRQQTLRGAIDWSYSLLIEEEQTLFARLSVFAGGWTFEAAEAVCTEEGELDLLEGLASLVDKSLVRQEDGQAGAPDEPRFSMLETIREYAAEKLVERGEADSVLNRFGLYYLELTDQPEPELFGRAQSAWFRRFDSEFPNIATATRHFLDSGQVENALRIVSALQNYWTTRASARQARDWLEEGLHRCEKLDLTVRARALYALGGVCCVGTGDESLAVASLEEALPLLREIGDEWRTMRALTWLGMIALGKGEHADAESHLLAAAELNRKHRFGLPASFNQLGNLARARGDLPSALAWYEEALSVSRALGGPKGLSVDLVCVGDLLAAAGRLGEARAHYEEALVQAREVQWQPVEASALLGLGFVAVKRGHADNARQYLGDGIRMAHTAEDIENVLMGLQLVAALTAACGDWERAARLLGAEASARERLGIPMDPVRHGDPEETVWRGEAALGAERWNRIQSEGVAMSLEEAINHALAAVD